MCGIAGIYSRDPVVPAEWIQALSDSMKHRGPDDEGYLGVDLQKNEAVVLTGPDSQISGRRIESFAEGAHLYLSQRRLSIIDLTPLGHQPMSDQRQNLWIVFNGEIYNYLDLKKELAAAGHSFRTNTDTEVLLAAYEHWGKDCLDRIDGMWAFVIYDRRQNSLFGARDRFGVKPFYYALKSQSFAFASEIKALLKWPPLRAEINPRAAFEYLALGWVEREAEGMFKNVLELPPSYAFRLDLKSNAYRAWKYYTLPFHSGREKYDGKKADINIEQTRRDLMKAVALHLQSDVPVGSCLSGGLDSSSIVCIINRLLIENGQKGMCGPQKVFTVGYEGQKVDETGWAKIVADRTGADWHRVSPTAEEIAASFEDIVYTQDVPFLSTSVLPQYFMMKVVREQGIKVLLDGQGGDELFAGYRGYFLSYFKDMIRGGALGNVIRGIGNLGHSPVDLSFLLTAPLKMAIPRWIPVAVLDAYLRPRRDEIRFLNAGFLKEHKERWEALRNRKIAPLNRSLFDTVTGCDFKYLLKYEERNAMRFSVEARTPFADDRKLIEHAFAIPAVYKIHDGYSKFLLRRAMKGILPEEIRLRTDKLGFPTPEVVWLSRLKSVFRDHLSQDAEAFFDVASLRKETDRTPRSHAGNYNHSLWRIFIFCVWKKVYGL